MRAIHCSARMFRPLIVLLLASLFCAAGTMASAMPPQDKTIAYQQHLQKGDRFLAEKNYAAAMFEYEKASDLMPFEEEPRLKMQSIEATLGTIEMAEVKKKVEQAKKRELEEKNRSLSSKSNPVENKPDLEKFIREREKQSRQDSLRKVIFEKYAVELQQAEKDNDLAVRASVYRKIAGAFQLVNDTELALSYFNKAAEIEEKLGKAGNVSEVYEEMADVYFNSGDFTQSISTLQKSLTLKEKSGDKLGASRVMSNIAGVYESTYDYSQAIAFYQESARLKDSIRDESGLKDVTNSLGDVYYKQKVLTSSILNYERTVNIIRKLDMKEALGPVYNKLGVAHYEMGNYVEAEKFFRESMKNLFDNGNRKEASMSLNNLGNLLYINNKYEEAVSFYERSIRTKKETGYDYGRAVSYFNLGNAYRRSGNQELAIRNFEISRKMADSLGNKSLLARNIKALSVSYEASKEFTKAGELRSALESMQVGSISIEIPVSENEMDLQLEKTQEILSRLNEEALKRKESLESEAENKMTDMYINTLNGQYAKEKRKSRMYFLLSVSLGALLIILFALRRKLWRIGESNP